MSEETGEITPEQIAAFADDQLAQMADPEGYAKAQSIAGINAQYDALSAVADDETRVKLATIRDAQLAALEPAPAIAEPPLTVAALALPESRAKPHAEAPVLVQFVEPTRDGQPWCSWVDAEQMLVLAAKPLLRGAAKINATGYRLVRDEKAMTLSLVLTGD